MKRIGYRFATKPDENGRVWAVTHLGPETWTDEEVIANMKVLDFARPYESSDWDGKITRIEVSQTLSPLVGGYAQAEHVDAPGVAIRS